MRERKHQNLKNISQKSESRPTWGFAEAQEELPEEQENN